MNRTTFADLTISECGNRDPRRVRVYAPNTLELADPYAAIDAIELGPTAGLVFENAKGQAVGWMLPGERIQDGTLIERLAVRAHVIRLSSKPVSVAA